MIDKHWLNMRRSCLFYSQTAPNPDTSVQRCRQNLNKLKRSVQKENTATLEKIVRYDIFMLLIPFRKAGRGL